jgi:hypothetical protein
MDGFALHVGILLGCEVGTSDMLGVALGLSDGFMLTLGVVLDVELGEMEWDGVLLANIVGLVLGFKLGVKVGASVGASVGTKIQLDGVLTVTCVIQDASFPALSIAVTVISCTDCTSDLVKEEPDGGNWVLVIVLQSFATIASVKDGTIFGTAPSGHEVKVISLAGGQTMISGGVVSVALLNV